MQLTLFAEFFKKNLMLIQKTISSSPFSYLYFMYLKNRFTASEAVFLSLIDTITAPLIYELIDHIDVYEAEGKGKNKNTEIIIHYRFIGVIENPVKEENIVLETRQGVAVKYLTA